MTTKRKPARPLVDKIEIVYRNPHDLTEDAANPRTIDEDAAGRLGDGLEYFGFVLPVVFNVRNGEIIGGHQRRLQAIERELEAVPVVEVDLSPEDAAALSILLNNDEAQGKWEPDKLGARLRQLEGFGRVNVTGFAPATLKRLGVGEDEEPDVVDVSFKATRGRDPDAGERPDAPETQAGDVWALGDHLVVCADSFQLDLRRLNDGRAADLVLTDPPYAIFGSSTGVAADVTDDRMVRPFFEAVGRLIAKAVDAHGHGYVHCDWRSWAALWEGFRAGGVAVRNMIVWDKGGGLGSNYGNAHELVAFVHYVPKASNTFDNRRDSQYRPVYALNVFRENRPHGADRLHNAAKPVPLLERLIENSTDEGATVVDFFAGSGSTLIAADNIGRRAILVEQDPGMVDVIVARWRKLSGLKGRRRAGAAFDFLTTPDAIHGDAGDEPVSEPPAG